MATSGSVSFDLSIEEIIEDAFERCGGQGRSGYDLKSARRSLNILLSEWGNRGLHFWEVANVNMALNQGQNKYRIYKDATARGSTTDNPAKDNAGTYIYNATDILEVVYRNQVSTPTDVTMTKIDRSTYQALANKESEGTPSQFFIQRFREYTDITVYMTPSSSTNKFLNFYYLKRIQDSGIYSNNPDAPYRFLPCMVSGLAFYLSQKVAPDRTQALKLYYEDELNRALTEDGSPTSSYVTPKAYYPSVS
tara:strand:- start:164 stop:913 length:750 start_codon:yes stop_codon:yes gene_type:complete